MIGAMCRTFLALAEDGDALAEDDDARASSKIVTSLWAGYTLCTRSEPFWVLGRLLRWQIECGSTHSQKRMCRDEWCSIDFSVRWRAVRAIGRCVDGSDIAAPFLMERGFRVGGGSGSPGSLRKHAAGDRREVDACASGAKP